MNPRTFGWPRSVTENSMSKKGISVSRAGVGYVIGPVAAAAVTSPPLATSGAGGA